MNNIRIYLLDLKWERTRRGDNSLGNKVVLMSSLKKLAGREREHSEINIRRQTG